MWLLIKSTDPADGVRVVHLAGRELGGAPAVDRLPCKNRTVSRSVHRRRVQGVVPTVPMETDANPRGTFLSWPNLILTMNPLVFLTSKMF